MFGEFEGNSSRVILEEFDKGSPEEWVSSMGGLMLIEEDLEDLEDPEDLSELSGSIALQRALDGAIVMVSNLLNESTTLTLVHTPGMLLVVIFRIHPQRAGTTLTNVVKHRR